MALTEGLDNPLERLGLLPNTMNWRGGWSATQQYYQNDVVVSPTNLASYILNGKTVLRDGGDPISNPDWIELSATSTGVLEVQAGPGITLSGTQTIPVIENAGVITIVPLGGGGIVLGGTPNNPIISTTAIQTIIAGDTFIGVNTAGGSSTITNNGVHTVIGGSGISVDTTDPNNPVIRNEGVLTIASAGTGITVNNGTGPNPTIQNDGVLELTQGTGGITITGSKANYTISVTPPTLPILTVLTVGGVSSPQPLTDFSVNPNDSRVRYLVSSTVISTSIANGDPGVWVLDLSGIQFANSNQTIPNPSILQCSVSQDIGFILVYDVPAANGGVMSLEPSLISPSPVVCNGGQIILEPAVLKAAGFTQLRGLQFTNKTGFDIFYTSFPSRIVAYYYPDGVQ